MCNPASMVVTRENIYWSKTSESHEDILEEFSLRDEVGGKITLVRIECVPPNGRFDSDTKKWPVKVDQDNAPEWWDAKKFDKRIRAALKAWQKCKVVAEKEEREITGNDQVWVYGKAEARESSRVEARESSIVVARESSIVVARESSIVEAWGSSSVVAWESSSVEARGSSSVVARESSIVVVKDSAVNIDRKQSKVRVYIGDGRCIE